MNSKSYIKSFANGFTRYCLNSNTALINKKKNIVNRNIIALPTLDETFARVIAMPIKGS